MALKSPIRTQFVILSEAKNLVLSKVETLHGARPEGDSSVVTLLQNDSKRRVQSDKKK